MKNPQLLILRIRDYINIKVQKSIKKRMKWKTICKLYIFLYIKKNLCNLIVKKISIFIGFLIL